MEGCPAPRLSGMVVGPQRVSALLTHRSLGCQLTLSASLYCGFIFAPLSALFLCTAHHSCTQMVLSSTRLPTLMACLSISTAHSRKGEPTGTPRAPSDDQWSGYKLHRAACLLREWMGLGRDRSGPAHTGLGARSHLRFDAAPWSADLVGFHWRRIPHTGGLDSGLRVRFVQPLVGGGHPSLFLVTRTRVHCHPRHVGR